MKFSWCNLITEIINYCILNILEANFASSALHLMHGLWFLILVWFHVVKSLLF